MLLLDRSWMMMRRLWYRILKQREESMLKRGVAWCTYIGCGMDRWMLYRTNKIYLLSNLDYYCYYTTSLVVPTGKRKKKGWRPKIDR